MRQLGDHQGQSARSSRTAKTLSEAERRHLALKVEVARELGLWDKVQQGGWGALTSAESGRVGGLMTSRERRHPIRSLDPQPQET